MKGTKAPDFKNGATKGTKKLQYIRVQCGSSAQFQRGPVLAPSIAVLADPFGTNALTSKIIGCALQVHRAIGPGVFENVYAECLEYELRDQGLRLELQRPVPIVYRGIQLKSRYYVDIIVEDVIVAELKAVESLTEIHRRQVLTQLKLTGLPVGLLINFNVVKLTDGVRRIVNPQYRDAHSSGHDVPAQGRPPAGDGRRREPGHTSNS